MIDPASQETCSVRRSFGNRAGCTDSQRKPECVPNPGRRVKASCLERRFVQELEDT